MRYRYFAVLGIVTDSTEGATYSRYNPSSDSGGGRSRRGANDESIWNSRYKSIFDPPISSTSNVERVADEQTDRSDWTTITTYTIPVSVMGSSNRNSRMQDEDCTPRRERPHSILRCRSKSAHSTVRRSVYFEDELETFVSKAVDEEVLADRKMIDRLIEDIIVRRRLLYEGMYTDMKQDELAVVQHRIGREREKLKFQLEKLLVIEPVGPAPPRRSRMDGFTQPTYRYNHNEVITREDFRNVQVEGTPTVRPTTTWGRPGIYTLARPTYMPGGTEAPVIDADETATLIPVAQVQVETTGTGPVEEVPETAIIEHVKTTVIDPVEMELEDISTISPPEIDVINEAESVVSPSPPSDRSRRIYRLGSSAITRPESFTGRNTYDLFVHGMSVSSKKSSGFGTFQGEKYTWISYAEMDQLSKALGLGIVTMRLHESANGRVIALFMEHRLAWTQVELAAARQNIALVPIYETGNAEFVQSILKQTGVETVVAGIKQAMKLIEIAKSASVLRTIVLAGTLDDRIALFTQYPDSHIRIVLLDEVTAAGYPEALSKYAPEQTAHEEDLNTICFTSGTTGKPKGVLVTHGMLIAVVGAAAAIPRIGVSSTDTHFAYLPPAHIFERVVDLMFMYQGGRIGYSSGDMRNMGRDIKLVAPTVLVGVPRVFEKSLNKLEGILSAATGIKKLVIDSALASIESGDLGFLTGILSRKIRGEFGGKLRLMLSGGAALSPAVKLKLEKLTQVPLLEGYGMTETAGGTLVGDTVPISENSGLLSSVMFPLGCVEIRLADRDIHEPIYGEDSGELLVRGPSVFAGYLGNPQATAEAITSDGFVRTGDVAQLVTVGSSRGFRIVGRAKEIYKLENGEYIAPARLENAYKAMCAKIIQDIIVEPSADKKANIAILTLVPEAGPVLLAGQVGADDPNDETSLNKESVRKAVMDCMREAERKSKFLPSEIVRNIHIAPNAFSPETGFLTPTLKLVRNAVRKHFAAQIQNL